MTNELKMKWENKIDRNIKKKKKIKIHGKRVLAQQYIHRWVIQHQFKKKYFGRRERKKKGNNETGVGGWQGETILNK